MMERDDMVIDCPRLTSKTRQNRCRVKERQRKIKETSEVEETSHMS